MQVETLSMPGTERSLVRAEPAAQGTIESIVGLFSLLIESFGWPGTVLFAAGWAVDHYSTTDQKHRMIDKYILGDLWWPFLLLCLFFILAVLAQDRIYRKKQAVLKARLDDVATEKSRLQELLAARELRHGDEFNSGKEE